MRAESLSLRNFRNHCSTVLTALAPRINLITGENGAGKTSLLEALSVTALSKPFTSALDSSLIAEGQTTYEIKAAYLNAHNVHLHIAIDYTTGPPARKNIALNNSRLRSASELIGLVPIVTLTPDDKVITGGAPEYRRRFLSIVLSQASRVYMESEVHYRKALRHRNAVLTDAQKKGYSRAYTLELLQPWTESLIKYGVPIAEKRAAFIRDFHSYFLGFNPVTQQTVPTTRRRIREDRDLPMGEEYDGQNFDDLFRAAFERVSHDEIRRGVTLAGPHRDDVDIRIGGGHTAREYASQGQHKSLLIALRLAEYAYLKDTVRESLILLLDDVFSELDARRAAQTLDLLSSTEFGQTFITSALSEPFLEALDFRGDDNRLIRVERGVIV